jgi:hypothetical protein
MSDADAALVTRLFFTSGREFPVAEPVDEVVSAVRRDHPNPVKLTGMGGAIYVNWERVDFFGEIET